MTLIDELRAKKEKLTDSLNACTDEAIYDKTYAELQQISKALVLKENQERKRLADEAAAKKQAELDAYNAEVRRLQKVKQKADAQDAVLFEMIHQLYTTYSDLYDAKMQITLDTNDLKLKAQAIGQPEPPSVPVVICNFYDSPGGKEDFFMGLMKQYDSAARQLKGAKKRGEKGIPDKPDMTWYTKGHGQFYSGQQQG